MAVSSTESGPLTPLAPGTVSLTAEQFESFGHGPVGRVLLAPLSRVARGLNILVPGEQISAMREATGGGPAHGQAIMRTGDPGGEAILRSPHAPPSRRSPGGAHAEEHRPV